MSGPLAGIRIVDLTSIVMGPYATQILGDMGADVIKVESVDGDAFRQVAPFRHPGMGAAFLNFNRNKRSVVVDLKFEDERRWLVELIRYADVFVSTVRPQALRRLGLDYEALHPLHPRLIYCGAYGFSETGPYAGRPVLDDVVQAMSGVASLQGHNGTEGPVYMNTIIADKTAGLTVAYSIAMALYERERSGLGQAIEVPMFETAVSFALMEHLGGESFRPATGPIGYERVLSPYRRPYRTKDGYLSVLPYTTGHWLRFFEIAQLPDYCDDARVLNPALRSAYITELYEVLARTLVQRTTEEWVSALEHADIPMAPVLTPQEVLSDPHLTAVDFFRNDVHPTEGPVRTIGIPVRFSRTPGSIRRLAPQLGQHREEIETELVTNQRQLSGGSDA